jgi:hypothetical protein
MSSVNNINTQPNLSELCPNQLNVKTQEAHNEITSSHTMNFDLILERFNYMESLGNAVFNNLQKTWYFFLYFHVFYFWLIFLCKKCVCFYFVAQECSQLGGGECNEICLRLSVHLY